MIWSTLARQIFCLQSGVSTRINRYIFTVVFPSSEMRYIANSAIIAPNDFPIIVIPFCLELEFNLL